MPVRFHAGESLQPMRQSTLRGFIAAADAGRGTP